MACQVLLGFVLNNLLYGYTGEILVILWLKTGCDSFDFPEYWDRFFYARVLSLDFFTDAVNGRTFMLLNLTMASLAPSDRMEVRFSRPAGADAILALVLPVGTVTSSLIFGELSAMP